MTFLKSRHMISLYMFLDQYFTGDSKFGHLNAKFSLLLNLYMDLLLLHRRFWPFSVKNLVKKNSHLFSSLNIKILIHRKCCHYVKETFVWIGFLINWLFGLWEFFLTFFIIFSESPRTATFSHFSWKVHLNELTLLIWVLR